VNRISKNDRSIGDIVLEVENGNLPSVLEPKPTVPMDSLENALVQGIRQPIGCEPFCSCFAS
jgi:hypothetical protein